MRDVIKKFVLWKLFIIIIVVAATLYIPLQENFTIQFRNSGQYSNKYFEGYRPSYPIWIWGNFDGYYYTEIATRGYHVGEHGFFPLYPLLIRIISEITQVPVIMSALIVSHLSFLGALYVILKLLKIDNISNTNLFFLILLLFPTAFYYGAIYNDALFLLLACLCLYYTRYKNYVVASLFGFLATLARFNGVALVVLLIAEYIFNNKTQLTPNLRKNIISKFNFNTIVSSKIYASIFIPAGFFVYMAYTWITGGKWNLIFESMKIWNQHQLTIPLQVLYRYGKIALDFNFSQLNYWVALFEAFFFVFYIVIVIFSYKKIRLSYWLFILVSVLIPASTGTFQGMPRYALHIYPLFLALTLFLHSSDRKIKILYFSITVVLFCIYLSLFIRGYFVA